MGDLGSEVDDGKTCNRPPISTPRTPTTERTRRTHPETHRGYRLRRRRNHGPDECESLRAGVTASEYGLDCARSPSRDRRGGKAAEKTAFRRHRRTHPRTRRRGGRAPLVSGDRHGVSKVRDTTHYSSPSCAISRTSSARSLIESISSSSFLSRCPYISDMRWLFPSSSRLSSRKSQ